MITKIENSDDMLQAVNENLDGLLTGKRKLPMAKEVNNTLGKYLGTIKMQLIYKSLIGDYSRLKWFVADDDERKLLK
jgi:hypothetical protein